MSSDKEIQPIFPDDAMGHSAEYWAQQYRIANWAIGESDRLHREEIRKYEEVIEKMKNQ